MVKCIIVRLLLSTSSCWQIGYCSMAAAVRQSLHKWAGAWQNQQNHLSTQQRHSSAWEFAKSNQSSLWVLWVAEDRNLLKAHIKDWSDWPSARADLSLCWAHRTCCHFCHASAQITSRCHRAAFDRNLDVLLWSSLPYLAISIFKTCQRLKQWTIICLLDRCDQRHTSQNETVKETSYQ